MLNSMPIVLNKLILHQYVFHYLRQKHVYMLDLLSLLSGLHYMMPRVLFHVLTCIKYMTVLPKFYVTPIFLSLNNFNPFL